MLRDVFYSFFQPIQDNKNDFNFFHFCPKFQQTGYWLSLHYSVLCSKLCNCALFSDPYKFCNSQKNKSINDSISSRFSLARLEKNTLRVSFLGFLLLCGFSFSTCILQTLPGLWSCQSLNSQSFPFPFLHFQLLGCIL